MDKGLVKVCQIEIRALNQAVSRNIGGFSPTFRLQFSEEKFGNWKS